MGLKRLQADSIDVLITDPPYQTVARSGGENGHLKDWFKAGLSWPQIGQVLALAWRRMAPDGIAFVMTNSDGLQAALAAVAQAGFGRTRLITWDKQTPGLGGGLRHQTEYVIVGYLPGSRTLAGTDLVSVGAVGPGTADRYPTQKPDGLGRELARIASVKRGDVVVDPFCGSGSLLVGAAERGATVIGFDVAARAIGLATKRLHGPRVAAPASRPPSLDGRRSAAKPASRNSARRVPRKPAR